ncbi:MAG: hypothetical protein WCW66_01745 [Patescibacteria group bacterium]
MGIESKNPEDIDAKIPEVEVQQERREQEQFSDLSIFTTTMYGTDEISRVRQELAVNFLKNAQALGIKCVVVDGGSNQEFLDEISQFDNIEIVVDPTLKMGESRRTALQIAIEKYATPYFLWSEPEKDGLIQMETLKAMIDGLRTGQSDIIVPRRASTESMPKFQAWIEARANKRASGLKGPKPDEAEEILDLWFGPKMFNRDGAESFINYQGELDKWDSIIKPVLDAAQAGKRISSVDVDYQYDPSQTKSEEQNREIKRKRMEQYATILKELGDKYWIEKLAPKEE